MDGINRKTLTDVHVPQNDTVRRPSVAPTTPVHHNVAPKGEGSGRIDNNPFFKKDRRDDTRKTRGGREGSHTLLWGIAGLAVLGLMFVVGNYFSSATIEVVPVTEQAVLNSEFSAAKESTDGGLVFKFLSLPAEEKTKEVSTTVEKKIQQKATGKVTIYNSYSKDPQPLVINTRLKDDKTNKIYRIKDSVVVPGAKIVGGKVTESGSVGVTIYADVPGESWNITDRGADFHIPGFNGDPRYEKFIARSNPDSPIAGGFSGTISVPTDEDIALAQQELKDDLKKSVVEKARAEIPPGMSFFPGSVVVKFEEVPQNLSNDEAGRVSVKATVSVFFFDTAVLTQKLADAASLNAKDTAFSLPDLTTLNFAFVDPVDNVVLSDISKITFRITGNANFVGKIDAKKLQNDLAGKDKSVLSSIINQQSNIKKTNLTIRPFWQTVFPVDPEKITIKTVAE